MRIRGGGGGGSSIPGLTSDGENPGGIRVAGGIVVGNPAATAEPTFSTIYGTIFFQDTTGNNEDGDPLIRIIQNHAVPADGFGTYGINASRSGDISAADYGSPFVNIGDGTASAQPVLFVIKGDAILAVDGDGVQIDGKIKVGSAVTHTLGVYSGKSVPIYDDSGTLIGYMPLYA